MMTAEHRCFYQNVQCSVQGRGEGSDRWHAYDFNASAQMKINYATDKH